MTMTVPIRLEADYLVETAIDPRKAVEIMAGEQSSGTFVAVPGETPELKERAAARIERLEVLDEPVAGPALPTGGAVDPARLRRARATLSWPMANLGPSLPNMLATVGGNLFELRQFTGLRVTDIRLPQGFADRYGGPRFGIDGTRRLAGVQQRPLIGTIIKPSVGFDPEETASLVAALCDGGIDFIKDDELQADGPHCRFDDRVRAVMRVINAHADRTGKKVMYAFNLTGEMDEMRHRHDLLVEAGGTCVMASIHSIGLAAFVELARHTALPIHAHRNGWGALTRHPLLGWSYVAWQKVWRLAGADHMHVNGLDNKFSESNESVIRSARECLTPMFPDKPCLAVPVFSSGQTVRQAPGTFAALGGTDLIVTAGGGIMAHPGGPADGVRALRDAWDAAVAGVPLADYARDRPALAQALAQAGAA
jgi:ribulose-bisphosphate carboxylase large chain